MNLFPNYNREGKGVTKAEVSAETPLKRFFAEFVHRFWQLILLNLIYLLACIPIITIGPATAAMNYVCRNFSQAKPVFFFSDFIEKCKEHFKQGVIVWLIQLVCGALLIGSYFNWTDAGLDVSGSFRTVAMVVLFVFAYLLVFASFYIYPMMVSFDLSVKQLIRNSIILAMSQLWRNVVMLLVLAVLVILTFLLWPLSLPIPLFLAFAVMGFVSNSLVFPVLKRYVAAPDTPEPEEPESTEEEQAE